MQTWDGRAAFESRGNVGTKPWSIISCFLHNMLLNKHIHSGIKNLFVFREKCRGGGMWHCGGKSRKEKKNFPWTVTVTQGSLDKSCHKGRDCTIFPPWKFIGVLSKVKTSRWEVSQRESKSSVTSFVAKVAPSSASSTTIGTPVVAGSSTSIPFSKREMDDFSWPWTA